MASIEGTHRPAEHLTQGAVTLRRWRAADAELVLSLVRESLDHLRPWMPWARSDYSLADATGYLQLAETQWAEATAFQYLIVANGTPAGSAGLMARIGAGGLEIGYWVHPDHTGQGVATAAAAALTEAALQLPGIDRVEIHHDAANLASERVPVKLGYRHVATGPTDTDERAPGESGIAKVWRITR
jgi:ribosomal-protein-serine acetyltransferase